MNKIFFRLRVLAAVVVGLLIVSAFSGLFYPVQIFDVQVTASARRLLADFSLSAAILFIGLFLITFLFGRVYCSTLCPLGLFQEFLMFLFRRQISVNKSGPCKYFIAALFWGALAGGMIYGTRFLDPYVLFASIEGGGFDGLAVLGLLAVLVWFKGRFFCTHICPAGTVLGLVSRHAVNQVYIENGQCVSCGLCVLKCPAGSIDVKNKTVDNETCIKCFRCMDVCRRGGVHFCKPPQTVIPFSPARRSLLIGGGAAIIFAAAVKGGVQFGQRAVSKIKNVILPAGAGNAKDFAGRCLNCNLCVKNCPMKILKKADKDYPAVHIAYDNGFCDYDCNQCARVCPSGAIKRISLDTKQQTQIGLAVIDEKLCIKCGLCEMKCPKGIITKAGGGYPHLRTAGCIGCGTCQNACPAKAITISAIERQRIL